MRKILFVALLFSFFSCKKAKEVKMLKQDIVGTWELKKVVGYPFNQQPLPPGNGRIMFLKKMDFLKENNMIPLLSAGATVCELRKTAMKEILILFSQQLKALQEITNI